VYYGALHVINGTASLATQYDAALELAACWKACEQQQADASNAVTDAGALASRQWRELARDYRSQYRAMVRPLKGIRPARLYAALGAAPSQTTDPGP